MLQDCIFSLVEHINKLAVIGDYGDAFERISGGNEPPKKAIGAAIWKTKHQDISNFTACKAQGNQHKIRIGHFQVAFCLVIRVRLRAQPFM